MDSAKTQGWLRQCALAVLGLVFCGAALGAPAEGDPAPDFSLPDRSGAQVSLGDLRGNVVLINFWATWCPPCRAEMPLLDQLATRYGPLGVTLLGVNVEQDRALAERFLEDVPVGFPVLFDPQETVSKLYGVPAMPTTVIVDRAGKVRYVHHGYRAGDESVVQDALRSIVRERS